MADDAGKEMAADDGAQWVHTRKDNRCGCLTLDRPAALNAISVPMLRRMRAFLEACREDPHIYGIVLQSAVPEAFSVGGDIKLLRQAALSDLQDAARLLAEEYHYYWFLACYTKPHVALINGRVMGSGVGVSLYGTHRVAGENYAFAMPETAIGYFPDVGGAWFLSRLPGEIGLYLGLTGEVVTAADAYHLGLATHVIPAAKFPLIHEAMREAEPIDPLLDDLHETPEPGPIMAMRPWIDGAFSANRVEDILARLAVMEGKGASWAEKTAARLRQRSPLSLKITLKQIRRGRKLGLKSALEMEFALGLRVLEGKDFFEGVRAQVIDKDRNPRWSPPSLAEVTDEMVAAHFAPLPPDAALTLPEPPPIPAIG